MQSNTICIIIIYKWKFALCVVSGGGLNIKMLKRTADLGESSGSHGPPPAQAKKLDIPKKTKLFVDQTLRERESAVSEYKSKNCILKIENINLFLNGVSETLKHIL